MLLLKKQLSVISVIMKSIIVRKLERSITFAVGYVRTGIAHMELLCRVKEKRKKD